LRRLHAGDLASASPPRPTEIPSLGVKHLRIHAV